MKDHMAVAAERLARRVARGEPEVCWEWTGMKLDAVEHELAAVTT